MRPRPDECTDDVLKFLDALRDSGVTNMWGAGTYVEEEFNVSKSVAKDCLLYWMASFGARHPEEG